MTTFKEIRGTTIEVVSSDPSNPEIGQIWYNSSSGTLKGYLNTGTGIWSSGGNVPLSRYGTGSAGTQTAALNWGGYAQVPDSVNAATISYNGSTWTTLPASINTARNKMGSAGTQTAALGFGGDPFAGPRASTATESWNGTSWTTVNSLNTGRLGFGGAGIQTAALFAGGTGAAPTFTDQSAVESWNGTSWTTTTSLPSAKGQGFGAFGTRDAFTGFGNGPESTSVLNWNGSAWTAGTSLNTARDSASSSGTQTLGLVYGGTPNKTATEIWNGSSWTSNPVGLTTGRGNMNVGPTGPSSECLAISGGPTTVSTEEWTYPNITTKTITVS